MSIMIKLRKKYLNLKSRAYPETPTIIVFVTYTLLQIMTISIALFFPSSMTENLLWVTFAISTLAVVILLPKALRFGRTQPQDSDDDRPWALFKPE